MVNMIKILLVVIVLLIIAAIAMFGRDFKRVFRVKLLKTPHEEGKMLTILTTILPAVVALAYYFSNKPDATIVMWLGMLIFLGAGALQLIVVKQLAGEDNLVQRLHKDFAKAQTGLFKKIRHPSKTALLAGLVGLSLLTGSWWALVLVVIFFLPSVLFRISQEERAMFEEFGEKWAVYQKDSNKLIPGIL